MADLGDGSATFKPRTRPVSSHLENATRFLRHPSPSQGPVADTSPAEWGEPESDMDDGGEATKINSDVDFLKAMEEDDTAARRKDKRLSSGSRHGKRTSLPTISLSGTKSLLAGRFGDAFRRFESNQTHEPDPGVLDRDSLTPIASSEATEGRIDDLALDHEVEEAPPEVRRELERRRLSEEERRVAEAGAAYKQRVASAGVGAGGPARPRDYTRAKSIQNKVQALLDESSKASPTKTAAGYGRYTTSPPPADGPAAPPPEPSGPVARKPLAAPTVATDLPPRAVAAPPASAPPVGPSERALPLAPRPNPAPKPRALRAGGAASPRAASPRAPASAAAAAAHPQPQLVAATSAPPAEHDAPRAEDWEASFSRRYPSLSGLEMVETEIDKGVPTAAAAAAASGIKNSS